MSPRLGEPPPSSSAEQLVERDDVDQGQLAEELAHLLDVHVHRLGDLFVGRACGCSLASSSATVRSNCAGLHAHRPRDPVGVAQLVDDRAADAGHRVALELDLAGGLVAGDRVDQPEGAVGDQVGLLDVRGQTAADPAGDVLDQRRVVQDQPVAQRRRRGCRRSRSTARRAARRRPPGVVDSSSRWMVASGTVALLGAAARSCSWSCPVTAVAPLRLSTRPPCQARGCACAWTARSRSTVTCV